MSIFCLTGGEAEAIYPEENLLHGMWEDRYFLPGIIHGCEDHVIRVYLNDAHAETTADHNQWEVEYIWRDDIIHADLNTDDDGFWLEIAMNLESFCVDSMQNDFREIAEEWPRAISMTRDDLVKWASC